MLVLVEGNIASGKSTVVENLKGEKFMEPLEKENPFLELFYKDPCRHATNMQIFTLLYRYRQWKLAQARNMMFPEEIQLLDRSLFFDACFAKVNRDLGNISSEEWQLYFMAHETLQEQIYYPDLCLWIRVGPETCLARLKERARGCEVGVSIDYLRDLDNMYCTVMSQFCNKCPVVEIDGEQDIKGVLADCNNAVDIRKRLLKSSFPRWKGGL